MLKKTDTKFFIIILCYVITMKTLLIIIFSLSTIYACMSMDLRNIEIDAHDCYTQKACNYFEKCRVFMTNDGNMYSRCQCTNETIIACMAIIIGFNYLTFKEKGFNLITSIAVIIQSLVFMQFVLYTVPYGETGIINTYFFGYLISYSSHTILLTIIMFCLVWSYLK